MSDEVKLHDTSFVCGCSWSRSGVKTKCERHRGVDVLRARLRRAEAVAERAVTPLVGQTWKCWICGHRWDQGEAEHHAPDCPVPPWLEGRDG